MRELERESPASAVADRPATWGRLVVLGAGRAGNAFAGAAAAAGIATTTLGRGGDLGAASGATLLLCVPDAAIEECAARAAALAEPPALAGHVSGVSGLGVLDPVRVSGAGTFSAHPLQTLSGGAGELAGAWCAVAGSAPEAAGAARALTEALGMRPFELNERARALYHAAACVSSNFLVALEEAAAAMLAEAGVEAPHEVLAPLVLRTAANWADSGAAALTGPIARGDESTVASHLDALRERMPELVPLYEALAEQTRRVAEGTG